MIGLTIEFDTTPDQTNSAIDEEIILYIQKVKESQGVRKIDLKLIHWQSQVEYQSYHISKL